MPLPTRMQPTKVSSKKIKQLAAQADEILAKIDSGSPEEDVALQAMIADWNSQVTIPQEFSDFRDFASWTSAKAFTRTAFNLERYYADFSWQELQQVIDCVRDAEGTEAQQDFALRLLEANFTGNPSDLIFWPDEWFANPDLLQVELTTEELAGYLMSRSDRWLADAPEIELKLPIPATFAE